MYDIVDIVLVYYDSSLNTYIYRDIAQLGRVPALGAGCRRFKSYYPDNNNFKVKSYKFFYK